MDCFFTNPGTATLLWRSRRENETTAVKKWNGLGDHSGMQITSGGKMQGDETKCRPKQPGWEGKANLNICAPVTRGTVATQESGMSPQRAVTQ